MQELAGNDWCEVLGIEPPALESVVGHRDAGSYSLLLVALLENGSAMTLETVAERFAAAGVAAYEEALKSLKRCRPARPPVYRHGDLYHLDPHSDELELWAFRLGLRGPRVPPLRVVRPAPAPLPGPEVALSKDELREAFDKFYFHGSWSAQRVALCVLDAHGGELHPEDLIAWLDGLSTRHRWLHPQSIRGWRSGAIVETEDGQWQAVSGHRDLLSARRALRARLDKTRAAALRGPDPVVQAVNRKRYEAKRERLRTELANLSRVLIHAYPVQNPRAVVLVDIGNWSSERFGPDQLDVVRARLDSFDLIAGWQVRPQLTGLGYESGIKRLSELSPPQKTARLSERSRPRKLTQEMLIRSCCNIERPLVAADRLGKWASRADGQRLAELLELDARSLSLYYEYGRLHGQLRVIWRGWQTLFQAPWKSPEEDSIHTLIHRVETSGERLEMVIGQVRDWADPWGESVVHRVSRGMDHWSLVLEDWNGWVLDIFDIQLARVVT